VLPIFGRFAQNLGMEQQSEPRGFQAFVRWATTLPQAVAVYLICLVLVAGMSFYAGSLRPKKAAGIGPPPISAPRN
jgi:hypothetical protein